MQHMKKVVHVSHHLTLETSSSLEPNRCRYRKQPEEEFIPEDVYISPIRSKIPCYPDVC